MKVSITDETESEYFMYDEKIFSILGDQDHEDWNICTRDV